MNGFIKREVQVVVLNKCTIYYIFYSIHSLVNRLGDKQSVNRNLQSFGA